MPESSVDHAASPTTGQVAIMVPTSSNSGVLGEMTIGGQDAVITVVPATRPIAPLSEGEVLIEVRAFSVNYRDRGISFGNLTAIVESGRPSRWAGFGSEFSGVVLEVGSGVRDLNVGDRVMPNHHYFGPQMKTPGVSEAPSGVVTNRASVRFQTFHHSQLSRLPNGAAFEEGAAFTLAAQTAASMCRRGGVTHGSRVLVCAPNSTTSQYLVQIARARGARVTVLSSRARVDSADAQDVFRDVSWLVRKASDSEVDWGSNLEAGFDVALDPFADVYGASIFSAIKVGGTYVTCGFAHQYPGADAPSVSLEQFVLGAMLRNLTIVTNCLGLDEDLIEATELWNRGVIVVPTPSKYTIKEAGAFFHGSFIGRKALGRDVLVYAENE